MLLPTLKYFKNNFITEFEKEEINDDDCFICSNNKLTSLEDYPKTIGGNLNISENLKKLNNDNNLEYNINLPISFNEYLILEKRYKNIKYRDIGLKLEK